MNHQEHDKHPDGSKTRTHRLSKLPDDGDPWTPNNLLTPEQKKNTSWTPVGQASTFDNGLKVIYPGNIQIETYIIHESIFKTNKNYILLW